MKNISFLILQLSLCFVLFLGLHSCTDLAIDTQPTHGVTFEMDALSAYTVSAKSPEKLVFNVSSNSQWKITPDVQWCSVTPTMSSQVGLIAEVTVECIDNPLFEERPATITIEVEGFADQIIVVTQQEKTNLVVVPISGVVAAGGDDATFSVTSNKAWTVRADKGWISFNKQSGEGTNELEEIVATITANGGATRSTIVTIDNGFEIPMTFVVKQDGLTLEFESCEASKLTYLSAGEVKIFDIDANIGWKASCSDPTVVLTELSDTELEVKLAANNIFKQKSYVIKLEPVSEELVGEFTASSITLNQPINFSKEGEVVYNEDGSVTISSTDGAVSRMITNSEQGLGTFIWKFSNPNFVDGAYFDMNAYPIDDSEISVNYRIYLGGDNKLGTGGSVHGEGGFWGDNGFEFSDAQLNSMTELKLVIEPKDGDDSMVVMEVIVDGTSVVRIENKNMWNLGSDVSMPFNFGFISGGTGTGSVTIESFDIIPYNVQ